MRYIMWVLLVSQAFAASDVSLFVKQGNRDIRLTHNMVIGPSTSDTLLLGFNVPSEVSGSTFATLRIHGIRENAWASMPPSTNPFYFTFLLTDAKKGRGEFRLLLSDGEMRDVKFRFDRERISTVPEPSSLALLGTGLLSVWGMRKKLS